MKIQRIRLKNFRQFYGDQTLDIAPPGERNVTLVHAENGVGKTTLLNAVLWALYEETSKKFEQRDKILNFAAGQEGENTASVELTFEHEGKEYLAVRAHTTTPGGYAKTRFDVMAIGKNGALSAPLVNPKAFINTVIPWPMAPNFFFDGEQAESFASEKEGEKNVADAIRDILGCTLLETSIKDLDYVERAFNKELGSLKGEQRIQHLEDEIEKLVAESERKSLEVKTLETNISTYETQIGRIDEALRAAQEAAEFQARREGRERELDGVRGQIRETESEIIRWIGTKSISLVAKTLTGQSLDFIDEQSLKGRIPSPYNEEFVKGLLASEVCVCSRPLAPGTAEWRAVQDLLRDAANAEVMGRVVRARARIEVLDEHRAEAGTLLIAQRERLARLEQERQDLERQVEDLGKKLEGVPIAEIRDREHARKKLLVDLEAAKTRRIQLQRDNEHAEQAIRRMNNEIGDLALKNQHAQKILKRRQVAEKARAVLAAVLKNYEETAREEIEDAVNRILVRTARKDYRIRIDDSFGLHLLFSETGNPTPKSGGENQLMSLAFIAALVQFAEKRANEPHNELLIPATVAPLILDSPFGQLDDRYREDTAAFVPEMAPQVILLVSSSQGKEEVIRALEKRIGAEYLLIAENKGPKGDKRQDFAQVRGQRHATTLFNCPRTMTRIEKV